MKTLQNSQQLLGNTQLRRWFIRLLLVVSIGVLIDTLLSGPLVFVDYAITDFTASAAAYISELFDGVSMYKDTTRENGVQVMCSADRRVFIGNGCNARNIFLLYSGFILLIPFASYKRIIKYIAIGLLLIFTFNVLRIVGLLYIAEFIPALFKLTHKFVFQILIYLLIFMLWNKFLKPYYPKRNAQQ